MNELELLKHAVSVIKSWHNIPLETARWKRSDLPDPEGVWDIYYRNAPEMKPIRERIEGFSAQLTFVL